MNGIGRIITEYERNFRSDVPVSDEMIQAYFSGDSSYMRKFNKEVELRYRAVAAGDEAVRKFANQGMRMLKGRQKEYLSKKKRFS